MGSSAHLIHGSSDGRFRITCAVGYRYADGVLE